MFVDGKSMHHFVEEVFESKEIQNIIVDYKLENERLIQYIVHYLNDMGIYIINNSQKKHIIDSIIHHLQHSPEIHQEIEKIRRAELARRRGRVIES